MPIACQDSREITVNRTGRDPDLSGLLRDRCSGWRVRVWVSKHRGEGLSYLLWTLPLARCASTGYM